MWFKKWSSVRARTSSGEGVKFSPLFPGPLFFVPEWGLNQSTTDIHNVREQGQNDMHRKKKQSHTHRTNTHKHAQHTHACKVDHKPQDEPPVQA